MKPTELHETRILRAPPSRVFAAWTTPALLRQWWGPPPFTCPSAEIDLRIGGAYRLANRDVDGTTVWISGIFTRVEPDVALSYTWTLSTHPAEETLLHVAFLPHPQGTELRLHHERFASVDLQTAHVAGWQGCLGKLEAFVAGPA